MNFDAQSAREKFSELEKLAPDHQASVLATPNAVGSLAYNGQAAQALALIEKLAPDHQASVLAAPHAVWGLAENGQAVQALALIEKLPPEQQASVLAAPGAKEGLTDSGQGEAVERIERGMAQGQTRAAKDDQSSDLNGQAAQILALIEKLTPEQQVSVLATPGAVQGLAHKEQGEAVEKLRRDVAQWRTRVAKKDQSSDLER
jgi:uncharacterized protein YoaH (UPF0181 family)